MKLFEKAIDFPKELEEVLGNFHKILYGYSVSKDELKSKENGLTSRSPQQAKKHCQRLSSLEEEKVEDHKVSSAKRNKKSNETLLSPASEIEQGKRYYQILPVAACRGCTRIIRTDTSHAVSSMISNSNDEELIPPSLPRSALEDVDLPVEEVALNSSGQLYY